MLVDTSAWIAHQRWFDPRLDALLGSESALTHEVVVGELSLGCGDRAQALARGASRLEHAARLDDSRVRAFILSDGLSCCGISWPDACLLASAASEPGVLIYTRDRAMSDAAARLGLGWG